MKALEDRGIGRPSTYASIIGTILDRGYVFKKGTALVPTLRRLRGHAAARAALRAARRLRLHGADGGRPRPDRRRRRGARRRGSGASTSATGRPGPARARHGPPRRDRRARGQLDRRSDNGIVLRVGRYGPYLERGEERASVPDDLAPDELTVEKAEELLAAPTGDRLARHAPRDGTRDRRAGPAATART